MLRTRLWMGAILILLVSGVLFFDQRFEPWFPFLLVFVLLLAVGGTVELVDLIDTQRRPPFWLCLAAVVSVLLANWSAVWQRDAWHIVVMVLAGTILASFLVEMATFREPGHSVSRISLTIWVVAYVGLLPSFLVQLRWLPERGVGALALAIFVPKVCDIGAYFTGRLFGAHKMSPVLSPKKTWEGFGGGVLAAVLAAFLLNRLVGGVREDWVAIGFGATVGVMGVLGDLAESLIKRDCQRKDASQVMPGFGGVLDVVDSIVFAAPVVYAWCVLPA